MARGVRLHIGAALDVMASFTDGEFDMVFMDADKKRISRLL